MTDWHRNDEIDGMGGNQGMVSNTVVMGSDEKTVAPDQASWVPARDR